MLLNPAKISYMIRNFLVPTLPKGYQHIYINSSAKSTEWSEISTNSQKCNIEFANGTYNTANGFFAKGNRQKDIYRDDNVIITIAPLLDWMDNFLDGMNEIRAANLLSDDVMHMLMGRALYDDLCRPERKDADASM
jgi:hypothetical protein